MADPPRFDPDLEWLDLVRQVGLVIAPSLLKELLLVPELQTRTDNAAVAELLSLDDEEGPALTDPWAFAEHILGWPAARVAGIPGGPALSEDLCKVLPEYDTVLEAHWAVAGLDGGWQLLVRIEAAGVGADTRGALAGWEATPHQRFERLLRETNIPIGVLITDKELRLVYAPRGETSGWIPYPLRPLATVAGRQMLGGLKLMLGSFRLFNDAEDRRLPALLKASREAQTTVSTTLAEQVVGALHELLRGLTAAEPALIRTLATDQSQHLYEGLLTVLMRLVFILYAEDRDLIPSRTDETARALYGQGYSARGLHGKLLEDEARYPDTMEERHGAWGRLIVLFRLIHVGDSTGWIRARGGKLFNPDAFPFLEGRASLEEAPRIARVTDGCVLRILDGLLTLKGERLSYRTLDVEQIGSVYETVMGFTVLRAAGPALAIRAGKHNRTPVFIDLTELAALKPDERLKRLKEGAQRGTLTPKQQQAVKVAAGEEGMAAALDSIVDERGSPEKRPMPAGTPILQPTDERRRTGSHYTPRILTEPIVRYALEPAFERLGPDARPEQVLDLKVCDPAMGSGAFLVEACRALAVRLVQAWARWPESRPKLPADEDEELHARRLIAQRCLYGVDKNPMATDLSKLSLWLATLARDHEFTFLDHGLKTGDSLVGLTRAQIAAVHWDTSKPGLPLFRTLIKDRFEAALAGRAEIREAPDDVERSTQEVRYQQVEGRLSDARMLGDAVIAAFFSADKPKAREAKRQEIESWLNEPTEAMWLKVRGLATMVRNGDREIPAPFHWEIEFPEVFARNNPGFDALVGNPPFLGGLRVSNLLGLSYFSWLTTTYEDAGHVADLVAYFFRRAFQLVRFDAGLGFLATNSIAQGDTRKSGLAYICLNGGTIYNARRRIEWPGEAAVVVSEVHIIKAKQQNLVTRTLDSKRVPEITAFLFTAGGHSDPERLNCMSSLFSQGTNIRSSGFLFGDRGEPNTLENLEKLVNSQPDAGQHIFPYLGGEEINSTPQQQPRRFVLNMSFIENEEQLSVFPYVERLLREKVKPERDALGNNPNNIPLKRKWWAYHAERARFYGEIERAGRILVNSQVSPHLAFVQQPSGRIWGNTLNLFLLPGLAAFCVLQSRVHEVWGRFFGSTLEERLRYTPSDCFETFPLPAEFEENPTLEVVGQAYHDHRAALMVARNEGMTKIYNRFHDRRDASADIIRLRELHAEMDRAVLRVYGWGDLAEPAEPQFLDEANEDDHKYQGRLFWPAEFRDEVLARLLALNGERATTERTADVVPRPRRNDGNQHALENV